MKYPWAKSILSCLLMIGVALEVNATQQNDSNEGSKLVTKSALGAWMLREDPANPRLSCAVKFLPSRKNQPGFAILGPTRDSSSAVILFSGANIPSSNSIQEVQVELVQHNLPATRLPSNFLARNEGPMGFSPFRRAIFSKP